MSIQEQEQTRTKETEDFYQERVQGLIRRCEKYLGKENVDFIDLAFYFTDIATSLSQSTVRLYKAMLLWYFEANLNEQSLQAIEVVQAVSSSKSPKNTNRTSGLRGKSFSEKTFATVIYALSLPEYRGKWTNITSLWLQVGALTGLRPHEWQHAYLMQLSNGNLALRVRNGKTTNNRSHGEYRHIDISDLPQHEQRLIEQFLVMIKSYCESDDLFKKFQQSCMATLRLLNIRLEKGRFFKEEQGFTRRKGSGVYFGNNKGKRVQLYTGRHRFSSIIKKVAELSEIAALMGHKTDKTATLHYGRTDVRSSRTRRAKPVAEEVAKIEQKHALSRNKAATATATAKVEVKHDTPTTPTTPTTKFKIGR